MEHTKDEVELLIYLVQKYEEAKLLKGEAESSPEGNPLLKSDALAFKIFPDCKPNAIEAERTFFGLLLFNAVLQNISSRFPKLSATNFQRLNEFTERLLGKGTTAYEANKALTFYSLLCNDLGKTQFLVDKNIETMGQKADDHDLLILQVIRSNPELFPGLALLSPEQQQQYVEGLTFYFNVGQFLQGENLPYNLHAVPVIPLRSKELRMLEELFDLAGATGHVNNKTCILVNDDSLDLLIRAIETVLYSSGDAKETYSQFLRYRAELLGLENDSQWYILGKLAALSRSSHREQGEVIVRVWNELLSPEVREIIKREFLITGVDGIKGILIYYFPAVIANAIKVKGGDLASGLLYALEKVAVVYEESRKSLIEQNMHAENGVLTVNVNYLARDILNESLSK